MSSKGPADFPLGNPHVLAAGEMSNRFRDASDALSGYIRGGNPQTKGAAEFAILHLVSRSIADLGWGQYLAGSGYPIQMYSVIRPVRESLNLIDLFVEKPDLAESWAAGKYQEFTPWKVREALGIESDPLYSFLSEHSHPRFLGLQISAFERVGEPDELGRKAAILYMGEIPFDVPPVLLATAMPGVLLAGLVVAAGHVRLDREAALKWPSVIRAVTAELGKGWGALEAALPDSSDKNEETMKPLQHIREMGEVLEQMAVELEAASADAAP